MQSHAIRQRANIALAFATVLFVALALQFQNAFAQAISSNARYSCDFNGPPVLPSHHEEGPAVGARLASGGPTPPASSP